MPLTKKAGLKDSTRKSILRDMKGKLTPQEWMDDILEYERTHEIAFASPKALLEARLIAATDKALRPRRRAKARVGRSAKAR